MIELISASEDDFDALVSLRIEAMRESLERVGRFDPSRARERFRQSFVAEYTRWIVDGNQRVGFVAVKPQTDRKGLLLDHLYIAPSYQGNGVGTKVLMIVFAEADALAQSLRVGALRESAANAFYQRHGFTKVDEGEWDIYYERLPNKI